MLVRIDLSNYDVLTRLKGGAQSFILGSETLALWQMVSGDFKMGRKMGAYQKYE